MLFFDCKVDEYSALEKAIVELGQDGEEESEEENVDDIGDTAEKMSTEAAKEKQKEVPEQGQTDDQGGVSGSLL